MWVSNVRGHKDRLQWEISIVKDDNHTGKVSYGHFGKDKIAIASSVSTIVHDDVWEGLIALSKHLSEHLNNDK